MSLPPAIKAHLIRTGVMTEGGITRTARVRTCRECGRGCVVGLDADRCAFVVWCDPVALTVRGERAAVLLGRRCYDLGVIGKARLDWRYEQTSRRPLVVVVASHVCGERVPDGWREPHDTPGRDPGLTGPPPF